MSDPNSNAQEPSPRLAGDPASGIGQAENSPTTESITPSGESGSVPEPETLPAESANRDIPDALLTNAVIEVGLVGTGEPIEDNDLHSAIVSTTAGAVLNIDYTLDQLISTTDLFDVPALDLGEDLPT